MSEGREPASLRELAALIRTLRPEEREALADDLGTVAGQGYRCPARERETGARCELDEGHPGAHTAVARVEWLVALRCRVGFDSKGRGAECTRIDGHDGPCRPRLTEGTRDPSAEDNVSVLWDGVPVALPEQEDAKVPEPVWNQEHGTPASAAWDAERKRLAKADRPLPYSVREPDARDLRRSSKLGVTYFFQAKGGGPVKIGFTKRHISARKRELEGPDELVLLAAIPGGPSVEADLKLLLAASRRRGEWFEPTPEVMAEVEKARAAHPLPEPPPPSEQKKKRCGVRSSFWQGA